MKNAFILVLLSLFISCISSREKKINSGAQKYCSNISCLDRNMKFIPAHIADTVRRIVNPGKSADSAAFVRVDEFYMSAFEVSNLQYLEYLYSLLRQKDTAAYRRALPDTLVWRQIKNAYVEPYVMYYLRHPSYRAYPVVGLTYEQALDFCEWLTKAYNEQPDAKCKNVRFDLPTKTEWLAAACGGNGIYQRYSWNDWKLQNKQGEFMANFKIIDQCNILRDSIHDSITYVSNVCPHDVDQLSGFALPVYYYYPNAYGLYNMNGNVEEMVKEKGVTKGGSWDDTGYYLQNSVEEHYGPGQPASYQRGFRFVMRIKK